MEMAAFFAMDVLSEHFRNYTRIPSHFQGVIRMAKDVLCEVNNCTFWEHGNKCGADQIYVVSNTGETADTSHETDCKTFQPHGH